MTPPRPLFVVGPPNTATSTLVAMLNAHPEVLVCYETWQRPPRLSRYTRQLFEACPAARRAFAGELSIPAVYRRLGEILCDEGASYRFVGDKLVNLGVRELPELAGERVLFIARDLREWLLKHEIEAHYAVSIDAVAPAIDFLECLLLAAEQRSWLRVEMTEMLADNPGTLDRIAEYLSLDRAGFSDAWWETVDSSEDPLKRAMTWYRYHPSSRMPPQPKSDVRYELAEHPFWEGVTPLRRRVVDAYRTGITTDEGDELRTALRALRTEFVPTPIERLYRNYTVRRHAPRRSLRERMGGLVRRTLGRGE